MKKTTIANVYDVLLNETNEITVDDEIREKSLLSLQRMLGVNA